MTRPQRLCLATESTESCCPGQFACIHSCGMPDKMSPARAAILPERRFGVTESAVRWAPVGSNNHLCFELQSTTRRAILSNMQSKRFKGMRYLAALQARSDIQPQVLPQLDHLLLCHTVTSCIHTVCDIRAHIFM